ncbi:MAG: ribonucleotide-diphosphate reductase subunit beta [Candidatus Dormibacteria bacterium]
MPETNIPEVVRRVEDASLEGLGRLDIDEVQAAMDHLLRPEVDARALYTRWERQQWAVSDLDFSQDRAHWGMLEPGVADQVRATMTLFYIGEQAVTDTLSPILHAAPLEEERVFLATQVADEARHTVFFHRFFDEVFEIRGGLHEALTFLKPRTRGGFRQIFDTHLADATDQVRINPQDQDAWVRAVVTYHLVVEGYLALTGQRTLLRIFRSTGLMPGFVAGFTAVARDESRHLSFGVWALRRRVRENPDVAKVIVDQVERLLEPAVLTVVAPDETLPFSDPRELPESQRVNPLDVRSFALDSLAKRLLSVGVAPAEIERLTVRGSALYDTAWSDYEAKQGLRHPVRFYQEGLVAV